MERNKKDSRSPSALGLITCHWFNHLAHAVNSSAPASMPIVPDSVHREPAARFLEWALTELQIPFAADGDDLVLELPPADRAAFGGRAQLRISAANAPDEHYEPLDWNGRLGVWMRERLSNAATLHARPLRQPMAVNDVTATLFGAYMVEGGQVHLAGCQLTDHPFLRLSFAPNETGGDVRHVFVAPDGSSVSDDLVPRLGLDQLQAILRHPPRIDDGALRSLLAAGRRIAAKISTGRDPEAVAAEPLAVAVAWVRHVEGRLQFSIGGAAADHPFSSWVSLLKPEPFVGKESGVSSFHLAATDDGRIEPAEAIGVCQKSGRRMLRQELVECSVTGLKVSREFAEECPVSGRAALRGEFSLCKRCRQRVSNAVLSDGVCSACRGVAKITKDDPRLAWILGEHPGLDRWKHWQLAETQTVYIAQASSLLRQLLVVVEKESLAIRRLAQRGRLSKAWVDLDDAARGDLLK